VEKLGEGGLRRHVGERGGSEIADRLLTLAVFEEFDLAQALFGFGFGLVRAAEIFAGFL
jgi:hypothetical protein